ncbi:MAG: hypothetical protein PVH65_05475 [Chloroflexota bacterium]|jgi:hypothetical protein
MMSDKDQRYLSYVLRLWAETYESRITWRASLEDVQSGERIGFSGLSGLIQFLEAHGMVPASHKKDLANHDQLNPSDPDLSSGP